MSTKYKLSNDEFMYLNIGLNSKIYIRLTIGSCHFMLNTTRIVNWRCARSMQSKINKKCFYRMHFFPV